MEANDPFQREITAAILQLRMRSPFFATLALFARISIAETVPTAATDGRDIFINRTFWGGLSPAQRMGLLAHEVLHAALLHVVRRGGREPILWNIAADIVVNGMLLAEHEFELPAGHIRDEKLEHLSVEEVYHIIQKHVQRYHLHMSDLLAPPDQEASRYATLEQYWRQALQQAEIAARGDGHGDMPAGWQREMGQLSSAQLDWRSYLWRFLVQTPTDFQDYDRRFLGQGLYLDTLAGESVQVYIAIDTSGSIGAREIALFLSEVLGILNAYPHIIALLYYVDAACHGPYPLTSQTEFPKPVGGGGTDFRPFFEAVENQRQGLDGGFHTGAGVCVYLTDGLGSFPAEQPALPVLWVLSPGGIDVQKVPFGEAVRLFADAK